jgi:hypothetical protein
MRVLAQTSEGDNPRDVTWITVEISGLAYQGSEKCEVTNE